MITPSDAAPLSALNDLVRQRLAAEARGDDTADLTARLGWSLTRCMPPHRPPCWRAWREGSPAREFATRAAVCDWVDEGAAEPLPLFRMAA